nr:hypothetical protein BaRGS_005987 [Batillaria attramentaria]
MDATEDEKMGPLRVSQNLFLIQDSEMGHATGVPLELGYAAGVPSEMEYTAGVPLERSHTTGATPLEVGYGLRNWSTLGDGLRCGCWKGQPECT